MKHITPFSSLLLLFIASVANGAVCDIKLGTEADNRNRYTVLRDGVAFTRWTEVNDFVSALDQRDALVNKGLCVAATPTEHCDLLRNDFIMRGKNLLANFLDIGLGRDTNDFSRAFAALNTLVTRNACLAPDSANNVCDIAPNMENGSIRGYVVMKNNFTMTSSIDTGGFCRRNGCLVSVERAIELRDQLVSAGICVAK